MEEIEVGEVFTITDENNDEHTVEVLAKVTLEDIDYVAVSFIEDLQEDTEEDIDIFFLKIDEDGDLSAVESDQEFDKVSKAFDSILEDE
ncbi:DUF1292 domain-containing protein [Aquibacillus koreensis]|uniref:DUF1292 domain-containing protein n=1 Tax=Aquibacillus koreensis TaxID=279446 RepID=A0A9X3WLK1_9BACI|nr:DUF1292 domain-containing protein [Aquibacillus koreensis]MCT2536944.1 DUF1292 domain-containing protein [Aquibacillus koreensis]MDC3421925.1 DUF1292 domain-containing protein [Aquibacillus koreensis]